MDSGIRTNGFRYKAIQRNVCMWGVCVYCVWNNIAWRESEMHEDVKRERRRKAKADWARTGHGTSDDSEGRTIIVRRAGERRPPGGIARTDGEAVAVRWRTREIGNRNRRGALGGKVGEVWVGERAFSCGEESMSVSHDVSGDGR